MSGRRRLLILVGVLAVAVLVGGGTLAGLYADFHWFRSLGFQSRFWTLELAHWIAWLVLFVVGAGVTGGAVWRTVRGAGPLQIRRRLGDLEIAEALPDRWIQIAVAAGAVLAGLLIAGPFSLPLSRQFLFAVGSEAWGASDAILHQDLQFYVFYLPLFRTLWSLLLALLVWTGIGVVSFLLLSGRIQATERGLAVDPFARRRLILLGVAVLLLVAGHFGLSVYEEVAGGPVGYAQVHGEIPARRLLTVIGLVAAGAVAWGEWRANWRPAVVTLLALVAVWPLGTMVYPELLQRLKVEPNELELERPFIDAEVKATRSAFGLEEIHRVSYELRSEAPARDLLDRYTSGLPLWDERPLKATYDQLQGLLAYHVFPDVDADRYGPSGEQEQVAIAAREFDPGLLTPSARTWQNLHLRYTHGRGVVATAVDRASKGGEPHYFVRDLPPELSAGAPVDLKVEEPKFYFGERTTQYVMMPPDSFPEAGVPTGVDLDNLFRRTMFAWALGSKNILLRNPGEGAPRLMWRREVVSRVRSVVPFLLVDPNGYPVLHRGRVKWIVELYAASRRYPLSQPSEIGGRRVNYVNSVAKAVVDGVTGEVELYTVSPDDPLLTAYRNVFPDLFAPVASMPEQLQQHLRYPRALFETQARVLQAYHMREPEVFYQKQDLWSLGQEVYGGRASPVEPYFLLMPFPDPGAGRGADGPQEFLLTVPFTPKNRDNLSSFLMARNDRDHYGELWLFDLSGQRQVFGPRQVEVQIDQDPVISQQLSLWQQRGSRAIRGHLLLVPVEGYLLYVEPLFLVAEDREGAAPGLKRVIAAAGDRVAMGETLSGALDRLLGQKARTVGLDTAAVETEGEPPAEAAARPEEPAPRRAPAAGSLRRLLLRADSALRAGDLEQFGRLWNRIRSRVQEGGEDGG